MRGVGEIPGHIACSKSHLKTCEDALANGYNRILVLEDDAFFGIDRLELNRLIDSSIALFPTMKILKLCENLDKTELKVFNEDFCDDIGGCSACCYMLNSRSAIEDMISVCQDSISGLEQGGKMITFCIDRLWYRLNDNNGSFVTVRNSKIIQKGGFSDILQCVRN